MPRLKLTKSAIDALPIPAKDIVYWDSGCPGFGVKITPKGRKVFIVLYRAGGAGSRLRKYTIGPYGRVTLHQARAAALSSPSSRTRSRAFSRAGAANPLAGEMSKMARPTSWREDDAVKLQILDEGSGIPPEDLERIFDKFHRAQKEDQGRAGTGLGLAISRGFIEAMGGSIVAANQSDRPGAVFTITLPIPKPTERLDTAA
jgi:signal transduction histidine kinase